jgi:hypothetical protein
MKKLVTALGLLAVVAVATPARAHGDFSFAIGLPGFFGVFGSPPPPPPPPPVIYAPPVPYYPSVVYRAPYYGYGYRGWGHGWHGYRHYRHGRYR